MKFDFKGKNILITGGACGIGLKVCEMYLECGGNVFITYNTSEDNAQKLLDKNVKVFKLDLSDSNNVYTFINTLKRSVDKIDILINNAGVYDINPLIFQDDNKIFSIININFSNTVLLTKYILKDFMEEGGCVINISSIWGRVGASCESVYASTKGAINIFTKSLSMEMKERDIKVLAISAGIIDTKMNSELTNEEKKAIIEEIPIKRIGEELDIANAIKFFSSDNVNITGEIINVDGGWIL